MSKNLVIAQYTHRFALIKNNMRDHTETPTPGITDGTLRRVHASPTLRGRQVTYIVMDTPYFSRLLEMEFTDRVCLICKEVVHNKAALTLDEYAFQRKILSYLLLPSLMEPYEVEEARELEIEKREILLQDILLSASQGEQRILANLLLGFHYFRCGKSALAHAMIDRLDQLTESGHLVSCCPERAETGSHAL